ncbi:MAG: PilZ domain-containing protein [Archangiaceae bacterium]|nr:PilZ domain-containing protein [Archangiaceae bacterium]
MTLGSDSNFFTGFTNDVSEGGLFVATVNLLPLGTQIDLSFSLPNGPKVEGKGEVRWVREFDEKYPDTFPGMGIKFLDIPLPSVAAIHAFTVQREPMFFPEN